MNKRGTGRQQDRLEEIHSHIPDAVFLQKRCEAEQALRECVARSIGGGGENDVSRALWETLLLFQNHVFFTVKKLDFCYTIRGNEMFVSRKDKSITRASVEMTLFKALSLQQNGGAVTGPKKLGTFGASYLYPIFIRIGVIQNTGEEHDCKEAH